MAARREKVRQTASPYQTEQSEWDRRYWDTVAMAIGTWLTDSAINLGRPIRSLTARELMGMAWAAIGTSNDLLDERERELRHRDGSDIGI